MSESWSQRMAAAVKKWGAAGPALNGRYEAARLSDLSAYGSASSGGGDLTLTSMPVPNQNGIFFHGDNPSQVPFGNGFLCTTGGIVRGSVVMGVGNVATYTYDNSDAKHSLAAFVGSTRNFQHWFRDPAAGGAFFNASNAVSIVVLP